MERPLDAATTRGPPRTDAHVPLVCPPTSHSPCWPRVSGWMFGLVLATCGIAGAADPTAAWPPIAPAPADVQPSTVYVPHEDLASRTTALVHQGRWSDVVSICEMAARKGTLAPALHQQYDLAKLHCDVARRHAEPAFRNQLGALSEADARRVYAEVLSRIGSHHVEIPDYARLVGRPRSRPPTPLRPRPSGGASIENRLHGSLPRSRYHPKPRRSRSRPGSHGLLIRSWAFPPR